MKIADMKARIEALEQTLDIERAEYERLLRDYERLCREAEAARVEMARLRAERGHGNPPPRRRDAA